MRSACYERKGPALEVLVVGEMPGPGEVRVRLACSGINPADTKKRDGWLGFPMSYPRVIPHSDGAGTIDAVGAGVDAARIGERVWVYGAQSYRPFGPAAEMVVVPNGRAVRLPDPVDVALAVPAPEIDPDAARAGGARVIATGRSCSRTSRSASSGRTTCRWNRNGPRWRILPVPSPQESCARRSEPSFRSAGSPRRTTGWIMAAVPVRF